MKKAVRVYIFGNVQGVTFRNFIKKNADELSINGHVRNKDDGSVEIWAEGNSGNVDKMVEVCKKGPAHAIIKRLDIVDEHVQDMEQFKILRI